jgi:C-terminal processing protease CtpA/Prc
MRSTLISLSLAIAIGIVIGLLLQPPLPGPSTTSSSGQETRSNPDIDPPVSRDTEPTPSLEELAQQLRQESTARQALQKEVTTLRQQLARLGPAPAAHDGGNGNVASDQSASGAGDGSSWFNQQALIDAGMEEAAAEQLKTRFEKVELEKLYLRDRAVREGWAGGRRFRDELAKIEAQTDSLKDELDGKAYAAYLYAAGQPNRVAVQSVLDGSVASSAGIQPGDQILQYADQRIYNWRDLRQATTQGDINNSVPLKVLRDGATLELYVQRGPLGIRMSSVSVAPE